MVKAVAAKGRTRFKGVDGQVDGCSNRATLAVRTKLSSSTWHHLEFYECCYLYTGQGKGQGGHSCVGEDIGVFLLWGTHE